MLKACSMEGKDVPMLSREQQNPPLSKMLAAKWLKVVLREQRTGGPNFVFHVHFGNSGKKRSSLRQQRARGRKEVLTNKNKSSGLGDTVGNVHVFFKCPINILFRAEISQSVSQSSVSNDNKRPLQELTLI